MTTTRGRHRPRYLVGLIAAVTLLAASCGNSSDGSDSSSGSSPQGATTTSDAPGVTSDEIRFSAIGTNSNNPLGTCVLDCFVQGIRAYFDWRNDEGGIDGRQLVLDDADVLDDELSKNQVRALEVTTANDTFATFSAAQFADGWATLADAGIPTYVWAINAAQAAGHPEIFANSGVVCGNCTSRTTPWLMQQADATTAAWLGYGVSDNSKQCAQAGAKSIEMYSDDIGGATVGYLNDSLAFGLPNGIAPEVTAMKDAGVDMVFTCIDLNGMKSLAQEMERQGMGDVPMYHPNTYNQDFVEEAGDLFVGDYVGVGFRPFEADAAGSTLDTYFEWMDKNDYPLTELAMVGWINADTAYQGIVAAGDGFTRQSVIDATNAMTEFTAGGLVPPIDWSRQHDAPTQEDPTTNGYAQECVAFVQVDDDSMFEVLGEPSSPWHCWPNESRDWSEPTEENFQ
jgi:ABC-type branched-subunit amino acid transport system substrate-binding protein